MDLSFLPIKIYLAIQKIDVDKLFEIRLRKDCHIIIYYNFEYTYLSENGITKFKDNSIICNENDIDFVIDYVTHKSLYAFNDTIKNGYITNCDGIRIGIVGQCVYNDTIIKTIKNFSSLNIRIPHEIDGCSNQIFEKIFIDNEILSTLIVSPPFCGKTTILKDLVKKINMVNIDPILLIDERGEFSKIFYDNVDKITYSSKKYAFNTCVRAMSPKIIITDELMGEDDILSAHKIVNSGIKIIASCHADSIEKIKQIFNEKVFDRYVILKNCNQPGVVEFVYDRNFNKI